MTYKKSMKNKKTELMDRLLGFDSREFKRQMVEGLDEAHVGQPGALAPNAAFDVDRDSIEALVIAALSSRVPYAGTVLTDELPIGTIQRNGVQWRAGLTEATALNLRCIEKTGTFKGSFKVRAVLGKKTTTISVSVNGVLANGIGYGTATVKNVGSWPARCQ